MGILGVTATSALADRIFNAMDKSGSETVCFEEYLDYMFILTQGTDDQKSEQTFRLFTKEKKDSVTLKEFQDMIMNVAQIHGTLTGNHFTASPAYISEIEQLFDQLDLKHDGVLDLQEYKMRKSSFKQFFEFIFSLVHTGIVRKNKDDRDPETIELQQTIKSLEQEIRHCIHVLEGTAAIEDEEVIQKVIAPMTPTTNRLISFFPSEAPDDDESTPMPRIPKAFCGENPQDYATSLPFRALDAQRNEFVEKRIEAIRKRARDVVEQFSKPERKQSPEIDIAKLNSRRKTLVDIIPRPVNGPKPNSIGIGMVHWGDENWNLILNMMLGIEKAVKSTAVTLDEN